MAAERTYLAWLRTSIALMAFGFVVARFAVFLRSLVAPGGAGIDHGSGRSLALGLSLIGLGVAVSIVSAWRHRRYVRGLDEGRFRAVFGSSVAFGVTALLALAGVGMIVLLITL
jgi:putative membrane protein